MDEERKQSLNNIALQIYKQTSEQLAKGTSVAVSSISFHSNEDAKYIAMQLIPDYPNYSVSAFRAQNGDWYIMVKERAM